MQTGTLDAISNQEDWEVYYELKDAETGDLVDLSGVTAITLLVRDPQKNNVLRGSLSGGEVTIVDSSIIYWLFPSASMSALCADTYDVAIRLVVAGKTRQLLLGQLPVLDGIKE